MKASTRLVLVAAVALLTGLLFGGYRSERAADPSPEVLSAWLEDRLSSGQPGPDLALLRHVEEALHHGPWEPRDLLSPPAAAGIPRVSKSWYFGPTPAWTSGTDTEPGLFLPLSDPMESRGLIDVRVALEMSQEYNSCELRSGVRFGNDGLTWNVPKVIVNSEVTAEDTPQYNTSYVDLAAISGITVGAYVQFGVFACNQTGSNPSLCNATLRVEPKQVLR